MASFDKNGKYIKTNWKAGDRITATKLNKIEESIEAVNDNDISRHVEADARLDALEAKDVAHDKELTNVKNLIADNKAAAELEDYEINSRMTFLEEELNEGIEEVHNVAETVDGKIATAEANMTAQVNTAKNEMTAQVNQGKADMEAMVAEVEGELDGINSQLRNIKTVNVLDLGCKADGIFDNSDLIMKAINEYNVIYFPYADAGEYVISKEISINKKVTIYGDHSKPYIHQTAQNADIFKVNHNDVVIRNLKLGGVIALDGTGEKEKVCIRIDGYDNCLIENIDVDGSDDAGIRIGYINLEDGTSKLSSNNIIRNCHVSNVSEGSPIELINSIYTTVENCIVETNFNDRWGIRNVSSSHNIIRNCVFKNNRIAIGVMKGSSGRISEDVIITDCIFDLSYHSHLKIQAESVKINNCVFKNSDLTMPLAVSIENTEYISNNISMSNCEFRNFNVNIIIQNVGNVFIDSCNFIEPIKIEGSSSGYLSSVYLYTNDSECGNLFIKNCIGICTKDATDYQYLLFSKTPTNTTPFIRLFNNEWISIKALSPQCRNATYSRFIKFNNDIYNDTALNQ